MRVRQSPVDVRRSEVGVGTVGVGFSAGGWAWLKWLSHNTGTRLDKLVLVDPFGDLEGKYGDFSARAISPTIANRVGEIVIFYSSGDTNPAVDRTIEVIEGKLTVRKRDFPDYGHFMLESMGSPDFPELVDELLAR